MFERLSKSDVGHDVDEAQYSEDEKQGLWDQVVGIEKVECPEEKNRLIKTEIF